MKISETSGRGAVCDRVNRPIPLSAAAVCFVVMAGLFVTACSSLPQDGPEPEQTGIRAQAVEMSRLGDEALRNRDYVRAEEYYRNSLDLNVSVDELEGASQAYNSLGGLFMALGRWDEAAAFFGLAEVEAGYLGSDRLIALAKSNLAKIELATGNPEQALELLESAIDLMGSQRDTSYAVMMHNRAVALKDLGRVEDAKSVLAETITLNENLKTLRELASNHYVLASILSKEGKTDEAIASLTAALSLDKRAENTQGIADDLYALAVLHTRRANDSQGDTSATVGGLSAEPVQEDTTSTGDSTADPAPAEVPADVGNQVSDSASGSEDSSPDTTATAATSAGNSPNSPTVVSADLKIAWEYAVRGFRVGLGANDPDAVERSLVQLIDLAVRLGYEQEHEQYRLMFERLEANKKRASESGAGSQ